MRRGIGRISKVLCKACHNINTINRGRANKKTYVEYKGGKCERCGYSKCLDALEFHHKNPDKKDPLFRGMRYWGLSRARKELDKCMLVCSNCHKELHVGL